MFLNYFVAGIGFMLFSSTKNTIFLGIVMFFISIASCSYEILLNVGLLKQGDDPRFYMNLSYAIHGMGGAIGPITVSIFALKSTLVVGIFMTLSSIGFLFSKSP